MTQPTSPTPEPRSVKKPLIVLSVLILAFGGLLASNAIDGVFPSIVALTIVVLASVFGGMVIQNRWPDAR